MKIKYIVILVASLLLVGCKEDHVEKHRQIVEHFKTTEIKTCPEVLGGLKTIQPAYVVRDTNGAIWYVYGSTQYMTKLFDGPKE